MENRNNLTNMQKATTIFKWTIRKYLPISVAYWILLFMSLPLLELFFIIIENSYRNYDRENYLADVMPDFVMGIGGTLFTGVVIMFSFILTLIVFSYMHNKRSVDLFGSFPVSHRTLFFARYCAVLFSCIVPMLVFGLLGGILTLSLDGFLIVLRVMMMLILAIVGNVSFVAVISLCCGTVADVTVCYVVINLVYPICMTFLQKFPSSVIPGFKSGHWWNDIYTLFCPVLAPFVGIWGEDDFIHTFLWILFSAILIAGSYVLCKKRKAETAQNAFAFSVVEIVIKFVSCFTGGFTVGWVLSHFGDAFRMKAQYGWFFTGMIIGILVTNILLHLIFHRGFSKFSRSLIECGVVFAVLTAYLFIIVTGGFGYDKRIPDQADIQKVSVSVSDHEFIVKNVDYMAHVAQDDTTIKEVMDYHQALINDGLRFKRRGVYPISYLGYGIMGMFDDAAYSVKITYTLKNGSTLVRYYNPYGETDLPKSIEQFYQKERNLALYKIPEKYIDSIDSDGPVEGEEYVYLEKTSHDSKKMTALAETLKKDLELANGEKKGKVHTILYFYYESNEDSISYKYKIYSNYENTLNLLREYSKTNQ